MSIDYTELVTDSLPVFLKTLQDNIFTDNYFLNRIKPKIKEQVGGSQIEHPVQYAMLTNAGTFSKYGDFNTDNNQKRTKAVFQWATYQASINLFDYDVLVNQGGGATQIINLIAEEFKTAKMSLEDAVASDVLINTASLDANGVLGLIEAVNDTSTTYGGFSRSTETWWKAYQETTATTLNLDTLGTVFAGYHVDSRRPTIAITTNAIQQYYRALLLPIQMISDAMKGNTGFKYLQYQGVDIVDDNNCSTGYLYFLDESTFHWKVMKGANMEFRDPVIPEKNWSSVRSVMYMPCFYCAEPRRNSVWDGITA